MIKGIFFDLGGTLVSYHNVNRVHAPLLLEAAEKLGAAHDIPAVKGAYAQAVQELTATYASKDYYLHRDFFYETFARCFALLDYPISSAVETWYLHEHLTRLRDCLEVKADCHATLAALRKNGLYLSLASNIDDDMLAPIIARDGFEHLLDHWTSSEEAQSCKPHRRFFELCLEKSGLAAHEVLFVGDSPEHDIEGANAIGMHTALIINEGIEPPLQSGRATVTPDYTIRQLSELLLLTSR
ncbi:MAG: HAD family hydrolase [Gammaproteobacteria bacterium]|nr:HAD family hydrolase [Gammaproteobacteria bacterium]